MMKNPRQSGRLRLAMGLIAAGAVALASVMLAPAPGYAQPAGQGAPPASTTFKAGSLTIEAPWSRATPGGARVAGGFMKITNHGTEPDRLIGGSVPFAARFEIHEMAMDGGVMTMRELSKGLEVKPGETVELKPGGLHVMFMGLKDGLKEGQIVKGALVFEKAGKVDVEFRVGPVGGGAPRGHSGH